MTTQRPRLALFAFATLALTACSAKQQPFVTASSAEPGGPNQRSEKGAEGHRAPALPEHAPPASPAAPDNATSESTPPSDSEWHAIEQPGTFGQPANRDGDADGDARANREDSAGSQSELGRRERDTADYEARGGAKKSAPSGAAGQGSSAYRPKAEFRPGLATQWGESRDSHVTSATFARAEETQPFAVGKLFYNDERGINAMIGGRYAAQRTMFAVGSGHLEIGLRGEDGGFITGFNAGGDNFAPGVAGRRYSIVVKNQSPGRIEVVASVDGLDVVDGRAAAITKRGYLMDPWGQVEIEGFRTSTSDVASFRFGSVGQSYAAQKHGDTRNVGVIGIAAFHERGDAPWRWSQPRYPDSDRRLNADPFPLQFASPPR